MRIRPAILIAALILASGGGCQSPHQAARQEATQRWNNVRAQAKARLASDRLEAGNVHDAATELEEAARLGAKPEQLAPLRARVLLALGDAVSALEVLDSHPAPPDQPQAQALREYLRGIAHQQQQHWDEAAACFARAGELNPAEVAYFVALVQTCLQCGDTDRALEQLDAQRPRFGWTNAYQSVLAETLEHAGRWNEAATAWLAVAEATGDADLRERCALALRHAGRFEEAARQFQRILAPGDEATAQDPAERDSWRLALADCLIAAGQPSNARPVLEQVIEHDRTCARALGLLARVHAARGDLAAALRLLDEALEHKPNDPAMLMLAAALAVREQSWEAVRRYASRLSALGPDERRFAEAILAQRPAGS